MSKELSKMLENTSVLHLTAVNSNHHKFTIANNPNVIKIPHHILLPHTYKVSVTSPLLTLSPPQTTLVQSRTKDGRVHCSFQC